MGGTLTVESEAGRGSTFVCGLPLQPPPTQPSASAAVAGRCLILHPEPFVREMLAAFCREIGLKVEALPGIELLPKEPFDYVLAATRWRGELALRLEPTSKAVIGIDAEGTEGLPGLLPLSRRRLRAALAGAGGREILAGSEAGRTDSPVFSGRLLVVEDNLTNQRVIRLLLEKMGCQVVVAGDGQQALQLCQQQNFVLAFMDMQMPVMDGLEATRRLRAMTSPAARMPIVALTANAMDEDRQRCLEAGMSGFLAKPIVREELVATLRRFLPAGTHRDISNARIG
jgi:CheY-like chemotaxis protein